ncbi:uncharacterized protein LOC129761186 [Toxorhynchites rutilus septentrionalis]|uniref:uncharacterized protein LOC129761186 n=1 Tax=Toxorhynchites rutilus septentrionalis TaxID=329112 RepID=UPI0024786D78|nr:uncharacterized protein LOC129761186 [Toxorhynchites rutilus septentrionalis]
MTATCHACATDIADESIFCNGFCKAEFHLKCVNLTSAFYNEMKKNTQLFWMCKSYSKLMDDIRFCNTIRDAHEAGYQNALSAHNEIAQRIKSEILNELKSELRMNFTALINSNSLTPKSSTRPAYTAGSIRSRRLFPEQKATERQQNDLMHGTASSLSPSFDNFAAPAPKQKFWLYLSRISCNVTVEQVHELAIQRLETNDIEVLRLVAKGKDVSGISFISFKLGISSDLKAKALSTATWSKGILFREFKDNRPVANFWQRPRTPNADSSLYSVTPDRQEGAMVV